jgi:hypothetical protein
MRECDWLVRARQAKDEVLVEQRRRNHGQTGVGGEYVSKEWWRGKDMKVRPRSVQRDLISRGTWIAGSGKFFGELIST